MPVALPEPDGEREGIPLWLCPNCSKYKPIETTVGRSAMIFAPVTRSGSCKGWCNRCLESLVKGSEGR